MREIRFRAVPQVIEHVGIYYVYGGWCCDSLGELIVTPTEAYRVRPNTVAQLIGRDSYFHEVYEGDLVSDGKSQFKAGMQHCADISRFILVRPVIFSTRPVHICPNCGVEFDPDNSKQIFCSVRCFKIASGKCKRDFIPLPSEPTIKQINCKFCGELFTPTHRRTSYNLDFCSIKCKRAYERRKPICTT